LDKPAGTYMVPGVVGIRIGVGLDMA